MFENVQMYADHLVKKYILTFLPQISGVFLTLLPSQDKYNQLVNLLPELRSMAQRGEDFLYYKHMQGNAPTATLLMEMLTAKKR